MKKIKKISSSRKNGFTLFTPYRDKSLTRFRNQEFLNGFTLLEVVVSVGIFALMAIIILGIFASFMKSESAVLKSQTIQREGRAVLARISRDIREGRSYCWYPDNSWNALLVTKRIGKTITQLKDSADRQQVWYNLDGRGLMYRSNYGDPTTEQVLIPRKYLEDADFKILLGNTDRVIIILRLNNEGEKIVLQTTITPRFGSSLTLNPDDICPQI